MNILKDLSPEQIQALIAALQEAQGVPDKPGAPPSMGEDYTARPQQLPPGPQQQQQMPPAANPSMMMDPNMMPDAVLRRQWMRQGPPGMLQGRF